MEKRRRFGEVMNRGASPKEKRRRFGEVRICLWRRFVIASVK